MKNILTPLFLFVFLFLLCPISIFAGKNIERNLYGLELGKNKKTIKNSFTLIEKDDPFLNLIKMISNDEYNKQKIEHEKKKMEFAEVGLNPQFPTNLQSVDIHFIDDFLYLIGLHYKEEYAKKTDIKSFLAPFINRYGNPQINESKNTKNYFWLDNASKLEISISPKIINVFLYDLNANEKTKDEQTKANDIKKEILQNTKILQNKSKQLFLNLSAVMEGLQINQMLQPKTLSNKLERKKYSSNLIKLLNATQETEKNLFLLMDAYEDKSKKLNLSPQEVDNVIFEIRKGRAEVDPCYRKYFNVEKNFIFKVREVYDFFDKNDTSFTYEQGQIIFKNTSDLAKYRAFIIEIQNLANQELQAKLDMQNISKN